MSGGDETVVSLGWREGRGGEGRWRAERVNEWRGRDCGVSGVEGGRGGEGWRWRAERVNERRGRDWVEGGRGGNGDGEQRG